MNPRCSAECGEGLVLSGANLAVGEDEGICREGASRLVYTTVFRYSMSVYML